MPVLPDDEPTIARLKDIKNRDGLNVIDTIAANDYRSFGLRLLEDDNGKKIGLIEKDNKANGCSSVVEKILQEWLEQKNATYRRLIDCLRESGMGAFAERIEAMAKKETGRCRFYSLQLAHEFIIFITTDKAQPRSADKRAQRTVSTEGTYILIYQCSAHHVKCLLHEIAYSNFHNAQQNAMDGTRLCIRPF